MKTFRLQRMDCLSLQSCRGVLSGSSGRSIVGNGGLRSTDGASEAGGLVASASGCSVFFQQRRLLRCWGVYGKDDGDAEDGYGWSTVVMVGCRE